MKIGSLCSGYGGLDGAAAEVFGAEVAWFCEYEADPSRILAHHWPEIPNHGDVKATDWASVEPVDIVCAGFPCQDLSYAGKGRGITEGTRSGLWYDVADAVGVLRPRLVVLENVAAIVGRRPGLDVVLGSFAALGFDAEWLCVRAADAGAPHGRDRWFLVAYPTGVGRGEGRPESAGRLGGPAAVVGGASDADTRGSRTRRDRGAIPRAVGQVGRTSLDVHATLDARRGPVVEWGAYAPAIARWERVLGRRAPRPTEPGRAGERLSPRFVEWLMGLPEGHVTDVPGLSRSAMLKALGNGVVPQQAALALRLLTHQEAAA